MSEVPKTGRHWCTSCRMAAIDDTDEPDRWHACSVIAQDGGGCRCTVRGCHIPRTVAQATEAQLAAARSALAACREANESRRAGS